MKKGPQKSQKGTQPSQLILLCFLGVYILILYIFYFSSSIKIPVPLSLTSHFIGEDLEDLTS